MNRIFFLLYFCTLNILFSQQPKKIEYVHSELLERNPNLYEGNIVFSGNVMFKHEGSVLTADTVIYYEKDNSVLARSNVRMNFGDTVMLTSKILQYDGNLKKAFARKKVVLKDRSQTLETEELIYDRNSNKAYFKTRSKIIQQGNIMYSNYGVYDLTAKTTQFDSNVDISTPDYNINSTQLIHYNQSGMDVFDGPTTISNKKNPKERIYTEKGEYNEKTKEAYLRKNSKIYSNGKELTGELLYFNQITEYGWAKGNVELKDPQERRFLKGGYGEYYQKTDSAIITQKPYLVKAFKKDSLYISADTLIGKRNPEKLSTIYAYHKVRMFKTDAQAKSDSLIFKESIGQMYFYKDPVFWNYHRQITGDTIVAFTNMKTEKLDSVNIYSNAFAISKTDSLTTTDFNQVKGRFMHGLVNNEELRYIKVLGNAESIIFVDDEDETTKSRTRIGINKSACGIIEADFYERQVNIIECNINGEGKLYPEAMIPINNRYLRDFIWRDKERPKRWQDIFLDIPNTSSSEFSPTQNLGDKNDLRNISHPTKENPNKDKAKEISENTDR